MYIYNLLFIYFKGGGEIKVSGYLSTPISLKIKYAQIKTTNFLPVCLSERNLFRMSRIKNELFGKFQDTLQFV